MNVERNYNVCIATLVKQIRVVKLMFLLLAVLSIDANADNGLTKLNVGVLKFGTVNWELALMQQKGLPKQHGFELNVVGLASKNAAAIALQAGQVDIIMTDVFWVLRQRQAGKDFVMFPSHKVSGGIYGHQPAEQFELTQLQGKQIGIAGGGTDKNWIVFNLYAAQKGLTISEVHPAFAAPPLLNNQFIDNKLDFSINFWHYNARAEAAGKHLVLPLTTMLDEIGITSEIPLLGWVMHQNLTQQKTQAVNGFIAASQAIKRVMLNDMSAWQSIKALTKSGSDEVFHSLVNNYPNTLLSGFSSEQNFALSALITQLVAAEQQKLLGRVNSFDANVFYLPQSATWPQPN